jgi:pimeloyl-ACP methyl ester carboxylesterase
VIAPLPFGKGRVIFADGGSNTGDSWDNSIMRSKIVIAATALALVSGVAVPASTATAATAPRLHGHHACKDSSGQVEKGFTCSTLTVPLDHQGRVRGTLSLQVGTSDNVKAPKGVLVLLSGGPGQPGTTFLSRFAAREPQVAKDYRMVSIDQRGTGAFGAIDCPELQAEVGSSDIAVPTADAVRQCSGFLGDTADDYTTDQTVADYDLLRRALGVSKMSLDGISYGTFTAERYAIAHPHNVNKVVLDSVLPHHATDADSLYITGLHAEARVLRNACTTAPACGYDPASDLAWVVAHRSAANGVKVFDMIVSYEFVDPTYRNPNPADLPAGSGNLIGALHADRAGKPAALNRLLTLLASGGDPIADFSSGLHAATLCADMRFPWGTAATPMAVRKTRLVRMERTKLTAAQVWPYTKAVAVSQGFIQTCLQWPAEKPASDPAGKLPKVPILLVNGDHDLSTPLEWARQELALAPEGKLVVVKGASHSIQNRELGTAGRAAVTAFLG